MIILIVVLLSIVVKISNPDGINLVLRYLKDYNINLFCLLPISKNDWLTESWI